MSAGSVSLRLAGSPGTTWTGTPAAARAPASSVIGRPQAWASSIAARSAPRRAACGVCAATTSSRSTGATTRSPRTRFSESTTGTIGTTAPFTARAAATTAATSSGVTAGRAASWTRTRVSSAWPAPVSAHSPAMTESGRESPPGHHEASALARRQAIGEAIDRLGWHGDGDAGEVRIGQEHVEAPAPGRPAPEVLPQLVAAHAGRASGRDEDRRVAGVHRSGRGGHSVSTRGWAKIIRPATVWSTRVTLIGTSLSMNRTPPSTTIIVPSSR